jgi:hypothetical protein
MAGESQENKVSLLMTRTLATTDALAKLLIAKGIITEEEFKAQRRAREPPQSAEPDAIMNPP